MNNTTVLTNEPFYTVAEQVLIYFAGILLSLVTIFGNVLVVVAYNSNKRLQTITNLFIFSLSVSDISVGIFSINFYTVYIVQKWPLGPVWCNIWLCLDYSCCQASVIHLLVICLDRYFSLMRPLKYRAKRTEKRAKIAIVLAWSLALFQWVPWIISYPYMVGEHTVADDDCYVQFIYESTFAAIITALAAYYVPVLIMLLVYLRIFLLVKTRERELGNLSENLPKSPTERERSKTEGAESSIRDVIKLSNYTRSQRRRIQSEPQTHMSKYKKFHLSKITLLLRQKKTAKLLSTIFLAFAITWLPYHIFVVWYPFCPECIPKIGWEFSYMFCYLNSTVNPFCYALGSRDFRRTFKSLLISRRASVKSNMSTVKNIVSKKQIYLVTPHFIGVNNDAYDAMEVSSIRHSHSA